MPIRDVNCAQLYFVVYDHTEAECILIHPTYLARAHSLARWRVPREGHIIEDIQGFYLFGSHSGIPVNGKVATPEFRAWLKKTPHVYYSARKQEGR